MKSKCSVTLSKGLLFLIGGFLILASPLSGEAQNTSVVSVAGTSWDAGSVLMPTPNTGDGSLMTRRRLYDFDKQGKVKSTVLIDKSAGSILKYEYNALSGRYENKSEMTMPTSTSETISGTYEIKGKSIYLDFPDYTVRATIYSDSMKGVLTYKSTNEKEEWVVSKKSETVTSNNESKPSPKVVPEQKAQSSKIKLYRFPPSSPSNLSSREFPSSADADREIITPGCIPKRGTMFVRMKDGSIISIDLKEADGITILGPRR